MKINLTPIKIRDLVDGYLDSGEDSVVALNGDLDVRPPFQREYVYGPVQAAAVIDTAMKGYPLNTFYWATRDDGTFEVLDGQQRTLSICKYVNGDFAVDYRYFHNLTEDEQQRLLDYELMVFVVTGSDSEKLGWFHTINVAGAKLTDQELRNSVYHGPWLANAKRYFSKTGCAAAQIGKDFVKGSPIRQEVLETALKWVALRDDTSIEDYMARHQSDPNANDIWTYYQSVVNWATLAFPNVRKEMKQVDWGALYLAHGQAPVDGTQLETRVAALMVDEDVTKKAGVYAFVLDGDERHLNIRQFTDRQRREAYERQQGVCVQCGETFELADMDADHILPWAQGGRTESGNCQMLCVPCNRSNRKK